MHAEHRVCGGVGTGAPIKDGMNRPREFLEDQLQIP